MILHTGQNLYNYTFSAYILIAQAIRLKKSQRYRQGLDQLVFGLFQRINCKNAGHIKVRKLGPNLDSIKRHKSKFEIRNPY